jgi:hypothetical protein
MPTYILQLLHGGLVCLATAQEVGAVTVAVLGVGRRARRILSVSVGALGVVLVRNVLGEVWRDHLADFLRLLLVDVLGAVAVGVTGALR